MIKLFRHMKMREVLMILLACVFVAGQVYFDLKIPDFIDEMTILINTTGAPATKT